MSNAKTYFIDPAILSQQSISGKASLTSDPTAAFWGTGAGNGILNGLNYNHGFEVLDTTATAIALDVYRTDLVVSSTMAFTLAAPLFDGQRKYIVCKSAASTPAATLTITNPETASGFACASTFFFDTAGQAILLRGVGGLWRAERVDRAGGTANNVVVGTTVLTGLNLWASYFCSVTGTVSSTTTKGIPNGSAIGELMAVRVSTAASIPSGTIAITALTSAGAAATTLGTMAAVANYATCRWNGTAWEVIGNSTLVTS